MAFFICLRLLCRNCSSGHHVDGMSGLASLSNPLFGSQRKLIIHSEGRRSEGVVTVITGIGEGYWLNIRQTIGLAEAVTIALHLSM